MRSNDLDLEHKMSEAGVVKTIKAVSYIGDAVQAQVKIPVGSPPLFHSSMHDLRSGQQLSTPSLEQVNIAVQEEALRRAKEQVRLEMKLLSSEGKRNRLISMAFPMSFSGER